MTPDEIEAAWVRWMHRRDIVADMPAIREFAGQLASQRMMRQDYTDAEIYEFGANVMLHAGLVYLHELAQDDEGARREQTYFEEAASGFQRMMSLKRDQHPQMVNPYPTRRRWRHGP